MLDGPEVTRLTNEIRDSFRIRPNHSPSYVDVANHLIRLRSKQHQVVFGRRGSGKSCLFVHFLHDQNSGSDTLPIYLGSDELKRLGYPDLLVRLLLGVLENTPAAQVRWRKFLRLPNAIQKHIRDLRLLLDEAGSHPLMRTLQRRLIMGPNKECYATQEVQRRVQGRSRRTGAIVIKQRELSGSRSRPKSDDAQPLVPRGPAFVEAGISGQRHAA